MDRHHRTQWQWIMHFQADSPTTDIAGNSDHIPKEVATELHLKCLIKTHRYAMLGCFMTYHWKQFYRCSLVKANNLLSPTRLCR